MNKIFRVPVGDFYCSAMAIRCLKRFEIACQSLGVLYLDEITDENLPAIREALAKMEGIGKLSLTQFDTSFSDMPLCFERAAEDYWYTDGKSMATVSRFLEKLQVYLDNDSPIPKDEAQRLLNMYRDKLKS